MSHLLTISDLTIAFTGDTGTHEVTDHLSLTLDEGDDVYKRQCTGRAFY